MYKEMYTDYYSKKYNHKYDNSKIFNTINMDSLIYEWNYQDTVDITFNIDKKYKNYSILITVFNFRHEPILEETDRLDECGNVHLLIDSEISYELFPMGIYTCEIQAVGSFNDLSQSYDFISTIVSSEECAFRVR